MRTTEENIVYQLLDSIRAAELNNDEVIGERQVRAIMRVLRPELILKYSMKGMLIQDICFQDFPLTLTKLNDLEYTSPIPPIIRLPYNFGIKMTNLGYYNVPVVQEESYQLGKKNPILKFQPKAMLMEGIIKVYIGKRTKFAIDGGSSLSGMVDCFEKRKSVYVSAILEDPEDGIGYNWTTSQYPMPPEIIEELKKTLIRRDLQVMLSTKSDQIPNMKNDTLKYYEQGKVQQ